MNTVSREVAKQNMMDFCFTIILEEMHFFCKS